MSSNGYKIITVDDHPVFREGLKLIVEKQHIGTVIAEAENGNDFLELLKTHKPDLVLLDIEMPGMNGIEATEKALTIYPDLKILIFSMYSEKKYYNRIVKAGAKGMVLKTAGKKEFEKAIEMVASGGSHFSSEFVKKMIESDEETERIVNPNKIKITLNIRETEVLNCLCCGFSAQEIADKLCISIKTVEHYRSKLLAKTDAKNTVSLVLFAIKNDLVKL